MLNGPQVMGPAGQVVGGAMGDPSVARAAARLALTFSRVSTAGGAAQAGLHAVTAGTVAFLGPLAAVAIGLGLLGASVTMLVRRINRQAQELAAFSGPLAAAQARSAVANLQQQVRSARFLGGDLARFTETQTRMGVALTKILDVVEKAFLQVLNPLLEGFTVTAEIVAAAFQLFSDFVQKIYDLFPDLGVGDLWAQIRDGVHELVAQGEADSKGDFFNMFTEMPDLTLWDRKAERRRSAPGMDITAPGFGNLALP